MSYKNGTEVDDTIVFQNKYQTAAPSFLSKPINPDDKKSI